MTRLLDVFDIFFHLSSLGKAQADGSAYATTVYKRHVIQRVALWNQSNHSQLVIRITWVNPNLRFIPGQLFTERKRQAMIGQIQFVFVRIKDEAHFLL
jgi:hypothetical protein